MAGVAATVLYEDRQGPNKQFGLHTFIMSCVFDVVNGEYYRVVGAVECRPLKGNGNVLRSVREDLNRIAADGRHVVAVFDNDQVRGLLELTIDASDEDVSDAVKTECSGDTALLTVALLKENAESVLEAAGLCHAEIDAELLDRAVNHKELPARDILFHKIARNAQKGVRDCILARVPSVAVLVEKIGALVLPVT